MCLCPGPLNRRYTPALMSRWGNPIRHFARRRCAGGQQQSSEGGRYPDTLSLVYTATRMKNAGSRVWKGAFAR